jgi:hypothetical protein
VIAGDGPAADALRELAAGDPRIRFVGRLSDEALLDHYARAHFVAFVPFDEDMGLVTLEAMKSGKPVLTVSDAGGVTEFVADGINGRVVAPDVDALAMAIDALMADRERLRAMGNAARATGATVTWQRTVGRLLCGSTERTGDVADAAVAERPWAPRANGEPVRPRILVLNTFAVHPPDSGGKEADLLPVRGPLLAGRCHAARVGQAPEAVRKWREFGEHFREILIPPDQALPGRRPLRCTARSAKSVTDITALLHAHAMPQLVSTFRDLAERADIVVASHLYLAPLIQRHWQGELWYDAHNVEADMKADILGVPRLRAAFEDSAEGARQGAGAVTTAAQALARVAGAEAAARAPRAPAARARGEATRTHSASPSCMDARASRSSPPQRRDAARRSVARPGTARRASRRRSASMAAPWRSSWARSRAEPRSGRHHHRRDERLPRLVVPRRRQHLRLPTAAQAPARAALPRRRVRGRARHALPRGGRGAQPDAARLRHEPQDARFTRHTVRWCCPPKCARAASGSWRERITSPLRPMRCPRRSPRSRPNCRRRAPRCARRARAHVEAGFSGAPLRADRASGPPANAYRDDRARRPASS